MARPREFDEDTVLDAAVQGFWAQGYEATSVRDLAQRMGMTGASLYNAFGDKRALYRRALDRYVEQGVADRIRRCDAMDDPRAAIGAFFDEIVQRSLADPHCRGCMLVNSALEAVPEQPGTTDNVAAAFVGIEGFFLRCVQAGQARGSITTAQPAEDLARLLLATLLGVRVMARARPEKQLLEGMVRPALALLDSHRKPTRKGSQYP
jgi:TetR/AcrR family transcriptional repressor of nem operon